jgi:DnaJ like chaperone protein
MKWSGKLFGGALGALAGGGVGAVLGVIAGHLVDDKLDGGARDPRAAHRRRPRHWVEDAEAVEAVEDGEAEGEAAQVSDPQAVAAHYFRTTFEVMGHVAKSDGRVSEQDIRAAGAVMSAFRLGEAQVSDAIGHFNRGKRPGYDLSRAVMALRRACAGRPDLLRTFLEIQLRAALGGSDLRGPSRPLLIRIAAMLGVGGLEFARLETVLRQRHGRQGHGKAERTAGTGPQGAGAAPGTAGRGAANGGRSEREETRGAGAGRAPGAVPRMSLAEAYEVLGVRTGAADDAVTKAYRRQLSRHHPDKLRANGLPESMLEHAKQRTQQIIEAWDTIRAARGMKP